MYKIRFEIAQGLFGYVEHNGTDTFILETAQQLIETFANHPYNHTIVEETA